MRCRTSGGTAILRSSRISKTGFVHGREKVPEAEVLYDRFHIVKLLLGAVDTVRREEEERTLLMNWTRAALRSRLAPKQRFARTIRSHMDGVLGFIRWGGITRGQAEGMNHKIKLLIHRAFGFHSAAAVMAMIALCCSGITP